MDGRRSHCAVIAAIQYRRLIVRRLLENYVRRRAAARQPAIAYRAVMQKSDVLPQLGLERAGNVGLNCRPLLDDGVLLLGQQICDAALLRIKRDSSMIMSISRDCNHKPQLFNQREAWYGTACMGKHRQCLTLESKDRRQRQCSRTLRLRNTEKDPSFVAAVMKVRPSTVKVMSLGQLPSCGASCSTTPLSRSRLWRRMTTCTSPASVASPPPVQPSHKW